MFSLISLCQWSVWCLPAHHHSSLARVSLRSPGLATGGNIGKNKPLKRFGFMTTFLGPERVMDQAVEVEGVPEEKHLLREGF